MLFHISRNTAQRNYDFYQFLGIASCAVLWSVLALSAPTPPIPASLRPGMARWLAVSPPANAAHPRYYEPTLARHVLEPTRLCAWVGGEGGWVCGFGRHSWYFLDSYEAIVFNEFHIAAFVNPCA